MSIVVRKALGGDHYEFCLFSDMGLSSMHLPAPRYGSSQSLKRKARVGIGVECGRHLVPPVIRSSMEGATQYAVNLPLEWNMSL